MIAPGILKALHGWFDSYTSGYQKHRNRKINANTILKRNHTKRVCSLILDLGGSLRLSRADLALAEAAALFHDIGRFEQFVRNRSIHAGKGIDHAALGVCILRKNSIFKAIPRADLDIILKAILFHNRVSLPRTGPRRMLLISKLLRDADKLDIINLLVNKYLREKGPEDEEVMLPYPDRPAISKKVVDDLLSGRVVRNKDLKTLNDFKLYKMGWLLDLNFKRSFEIVRKKRYLDKLLSSLPRKPEVLEVYEYIKIKLEIRNPKYETRNKQEI